MRFGAGVGIVLAGLLCHPFGFAQQKAAVVQRGEAASGVVTPRHPITLDVVVTPKRGGEPVSGLTAGDFTVLDNKVPQKITLFYAVDGSEAPIKVILVVDAVNSYYQTVAYERGQIDKFLRANGGHLAYPTQLAIFTDTGTQIQNGFSQDGNALSASLDHFTVGLRTIHRSQGFYGAGDRLSLSIKAIHMLSTHEATVPGRKFVLWISPGWPILSGPAVQIGPKQQRGIFRTVAGLSTGLREARITLYSIDPLGTADAGGLYISAYQNFVKGVRKPDEVQFGNLALQVLAVQSGGRVLNSSNDVTGLLREAMSDAGAYYELSFDGGVGEPDEYHQIRVEIAKPGLVARTRTGYYSP
ncbi:MAG: VWA domain-containing protein [Acidobacteriaceae bacterium]